MKLTYYRGAVSNDRITGVIERARTAVEPLAMRRSWREAA